MDRVGDQEAMPTRSGVERQRAASPFSKKHAGRKCRAAIYVKVASMEEPLPLGRRQRRNAARRRPCRAREAAAAERRHGGRPTPPTSRAATGHQPPSPVVVWSASEDPPVTDGERRLICAHLRAAIERILVQAGAEP